MNLTEQYYKTLQPKAIVDFIKDRSMTNTYSCFIYAISLELCMDKDKFSKAEQEEWNKRFEEVKAKVLKAIEPFVLGNITATLDPFQYFTHHASQELERSVSRGITRMFSVQAVDFMPNDNARPPLEARGIPIPEYGMMTFGRVVLDRPVLDVASIRRL